MHFLSILSKYAGYSGLPYKKSLCYTYLGYYISACVSYRKRDHSPSCKYYCWTSKWGALHVIVVTKGLRKWGLGLTSPSSLIIYKALLPAQMRLNVFVYFCLLICRLIANTAEW